jgi:hypothetical protein
VDVLLGILAALAVLAASVGFWKAGGRLAQHLSKRGGEAVAGACLLLTGGLVFLVNRHPSRIPVAILVSPLIYLEFAYFLPTGLVFFGLAARRVPRPESGRALRWLGGAVAGWSALHMFLAFDAGSLPQLQPFPPRGPVAQQTTGWSCGAAACVTLLKAHGIVSTEREMGELCMALPKRGTTMPRFIRGLTLRLRKEGSPLRVRPADHLEVSDLDTFPVPCILGIKYTLFVDHAMVLVARPKEGAYRLADPLTGTVECMGRGDLERRFTGEAIALE